jgi:phage terminase large subunit
LSSPADFPAKLRCLFDPPFARYRVLYGGRGSGKSWGVARALLIKAAQKPLRILCAREVQRTIADSVHRLLADQIVALGLEGWYTVTDTEIRGKNGSLFIFAGLRHQDIGKVKSLEGVDVCWVEEGQVVSDKSWGVLVPTIRKEQSEIWVTFNPELDTDPTYTRFVTNPPHDSVVVKVNWSDNKFFPEVLDKERQSLAVRDPEAYRNVWEGECRSAVEGAIYAKEVAALYEQGRVRTVPYDPLLPVHTVWDLGWNDQMSIILVQRASEVRIVAYIEDSHRTLAEYVAQLKALPYVWGDDWLPHDGRARDFKSGKSAEEIMKALGRSPRIVENLDVETGIKAARMMFPRVYIDTGCERLLHCLKRYRRTINQTTNEPGPPLHDDASHGADAFRYLAVAVDQMGNAPTVADPYGAFRSAASF